MGQTPSLDVRGTCLPSYSVAYECENPGMEKRLCHPSITERSLRKRTYLYTHTYTSLIGIGDDIKPPPNDLVSTAIIAVRKMCARPTV